MARQTAGLLAALASAAAISVPGVSHGDDQSDHAAHGSGMRVDVDGPARTAGGPGPGAARGGGARPVAVAGSRSAIAHAVAPQFVAARSQLDAARATSAGIAEMMARESGDITAPYRNELVTLGAALRRDVTAIADALATLPVSVAQLGLREQVRADFSQANVALQRVRSALARLLGHDDSAAVRDGATARQLAREIGDDLARARAALVRVERAALSRSGA